MENLEPLELSSYTAVKVLRGRAGKRMNSAVIYLNKELNLLSQVIITNK